MENRGFNMNAELKSKELELLIELLDKKLEDIGILGDIGERFDYGTLREKLIIQLKRGE